MFKRNQVEDALARVLGAEGAEARSKLRGRIKRALEHDRERGRSPGSPEASRFAFYSGESAGHGRDNRYAEYEAFALLTALKITSHDWPQDFVIGSLRRLRPELEDQHQRILRQDPAVLFDQEILAASVKPGQAVVGNTDPVFLVVGSEAGRKASGFAILCRGEREQLELYHRCGPGFTFTTVELVNQAFALRAALAETTPRSRGRTRSTDPSRE